MTDSIEESLAAQASLTAVAAILRTNLGMWIMHMHILSHLIGWRLADEVPDIDSRKLPPTSCFEISQRYQDVIVV